MINITPIQKGRDSSNKIRIIRDTGEKFSVFCLNRDQNAGRFFDEIVQSSKEANISEKIPSRSQRKEEISLSQEVGRSSLCSEIRNMKLRISRMIDSFKSLIISSMKSFSTFSSIINQLMIKPVSTFMVGMMVHDYSYFG